MLEMLSHLKIYILFAESDRGPSRRRKNTVPQLQEPTNKFDQRRKLSSSSCQKSNPDSEKHYQEDDFVSSASESYAALDDPWGKNSPLKRFQKMEKLEKSPIEVSESINNDADIVKLQVRSLVQVKVQVKVKVLVMVMVLVKVLVNVHKQIKLNIQHSMSKTQREGPGETL